MSEKMSFGKKVGSFLNAPFRRDRSRSRSRSPGVGSSRLGGPAHAARDQLLNPQSPTASAPAKKSLNALCCHTRSRSSSPSPSPAPRPAFSHTPANTPDTSVIVSGPSSGASASTSKEISSSSTLCGPAHATGDQSMDPQPPTASMPAKELLNAPFHHKRSRSSSPSPSPTLRPAFNPTTANALDTNIISNVVSGSLTGVGASDSKGIDSSSPPGGPRHAAGDQSSNPQPPTASMPTKNKAFERAVAVALQKHIDKLSDDDKAAFRSAKDVMERLGELQQDRSRISDSHTTRVQNVLQCVKQFLGSTTICIQHSPEISSLVVGGLNCVLTVSIYPINSFMTIHYDRR